MNTIKITLLCAPFFFTFGCGNYLPTGEKDLKKSGERNEKLQEDLRRESFEKDQRTSALKNIRLGDGFAWTTPTAVSAYFFSEVQNKSQASNFCSSIGFELGSLDQTMEIARLYPGEAGLPKKEEIDTFAEGLESIEGSKDKKIEIATQALLRDFVYSDSKETEDGRPVCVRR